MKELEKYQKYKRKSNFTHNKISLVIQNIISFFQSLIKAHEINTKINRKSYENMKEMKKI